MQNQRKRSLSNASHDGSDDEIQDKTVDLVPGRLIQPWTIIKKLIQNLIDKNSNSNENAKQSDSSSNASNESLNGNASGNYSITIPFGFQLTGSLFHQPDDMKSVLKLSSLWKDKYLSLDSQFVQVWEGDQKKIKFHVRKPHSKTHFDASTFLGLREWIYIEKWSLLIISTSQLEIKVMNNEFQVLQKIYTDKPALK